MAGGKLVEDQPLHDRQRGIAGANPRRSARSPGQTHAALASFEPMRLIVPGVSRPSPEPRSAVSSVLDVRMGAGREFADRLERGSLRGEPRGATASAEPLLE